MSFENIIQPDAVLCNASARSKKHCLEILSELLVRSTPEITSESIFECLFDRERLGCTSLDDGAAFPHCRVKGIEKSVAALIRLSEPIDFDAADGEPVDLVFGMMVPDDISDADRAEIKRITHVLNDDELRTRLRDQNTSGDLYDALMESDAQEEPASAAHGG